jgi:hypothetical protein
MNPMHCQKCGHALALADKACQACQSPVPAAQRQAMLMPRAEALAESGRWAEAARALQGVLDLGLDADQAKGLWRKKGGWLRRAAEAEPQQLDGAEAAFEQARRLDDSDEMSHQLWIDLLVQRGQGEKARDFYKARLEKDPADAVAQRQLTVLRLAADFKTQPRPKTILDERQEPRGALWKMIAPSPWKTWSLGFSGVFSLVIAINGFLSGRHIEAPVPDNPGDADLAALAAISSPADAMAKLLDPWLNLYVALACAAYVGWAYLRSRERRA